MLKLALGTVQFGLPYGINNKSGVPNDIELEKIFNFAKQAGVDILDTAHTYGNAEERIGNLSNREFKVITKFKRLKSPYPFLSEISESLAKLKSESLYGYISHDADLLIENPIWWSGLLEAKNLGLVNKIGYSVYSVKQLESLLADKMIPDLIQFPYNILDRRFEPYMLELTSLGVEIHTRSVFLQGLLQMNPSSLPIQLNSLVPYLMKLRDIATKYQISMGELCLCFAINNPLIDKVVIGVDNASQLAENIGFCQNVKFTNDFINELLSIVVEDISILNPSNWN